MIAGRNTVCCLVLLLCAACASEPPSGPEAACRAEAEDDPAVHDLRVAQLGDPVQIAGGYGKLQQAIKDATYACLQRRGIDAPGGVEPVRRY